MRTEKAKAVALKLARKAPPKLRRRGRQVINGFMGRPEIVTPPPIYGMVEAFEYRQVVGWVVAPAAHVPVRVTLNVNGMEVAGTWADEPSSRNTWSQARGFRIALEDIWDYCKASDKVTVRIGGRPIPIAQKGIYKRPAEDGEFDLEDLQRKFDSGYVFDHAGALQLSKKLDTAWQAAVLDLYDRVSALLEERYGYQPFVVYGTLLGLVRDGGFIGHDNDFDAAYISAHSDGATSATEMRDIGLMLIDAGFDVECKRTALHIHDVSDPDLRIDLFHLYFDENGELAFPFGIASKRTFTRADWHGLEFAQLAGRTVRAPVAPEQLVEYLYGPSWRTPIAGFHWDRARTKWRKDGWTPLDYSKQVYWTNFYAHHELSAPSPFSAAVAEREDLPRALLDLGCGDGRDSIAFARAGRRVLGLDRSEVGIRNAERRAAAAGVAERATFRVADLTDAAALHEAVKQAREGAEGGPVLFYLRFVLNSLTEDEQETMLAALADAAQPGDALAAEFRTDRDKGTEKTYGRHYRRYQNAAALAEALRGRFGFDVVHEEESTGLSRYEDEDPVLGRIVAVRATGLSSG